VEEIDSTIVEYKAKIHNLELQKDSVQEREGLLKKEAITTIQKVKESMVFQQEITTLVEQGCNFLGFRFRRVFWSFGEQG